MCDGAGECINAGDGVDNARVPVLVVPAVGWRYHYSAHTWHSAA